MKKINLKGISEILSEKEMKNVMGGSGTGVCTITCNDGSQNNADSCPRSSSDGCGGHGGVRQCAGPTSCVMSL